MDQPRTTGITDEGEAHLRSILATVPDAMVVRATGELKNIHAELSVIEAGVDTRDEDVISDTLVARARAIDAAYLLMGGYNHSRIGEYVFGGVTRTLLGGCPVPPGGFSRAA